MEPITGGRVINPIARKVETVPLGVRWDGVEAEQRTRRRREAAGTRCRRLSDRCGAVGEVATVETG